jgi:hypothetical protein
MLIRVLSLKAREAVASETLAFSATSFNLVILFNLIQVAVPIKFEPLPFNFDLLY